MRFQRRFLEINQSETRMALLLVPKVTTRSLYPEYIANLKLPIDTFYRESRSGVNMSLKHLSQMN
jgi:hypothetical protein